ncbi:acyl-coenzyme A thioesterase 2, mitochondrial-like [Halichoerus grypus]
MWKAAQAVLRTPAIPLPLRRSMSTSALLFQKAATLTVTPTTGLADELLDIKVEGLRPRERVTLRASAVSYRGRLFHSLAHYEADGRGGLDLARDPALGGDFTGVEPLGLLWSLTPVGSEDPCFNQMPRGVMKSPLKVEVKGPNIGVIGSGKGAELAFSMASFLPNIAAVVSINGCISNTTTALTCGRFILPGLPFNLDKISAMDSGVYDVKEALADPLDPAYRESRIPLEKANAHFLVIVGEDDRHWKSSVYADLAVKHLTEHGKTDFTLLSYPNAGHRIDAPYSPFFSVSLDPVLGVPVLGGGQLKAHAVAQIESWKKILEFLHLHLG